MQLAPGLCGPLLFPALPGTPWLRPGSKRLHLQGRSCLHWPQQPPGRLARDPLPQGAPGLGGAPCSFLTHPAKRKLDFLNQSSWPACPSLLHLQAILAAQAGSALARVAAKAAWCSQAATARVQMPADPKAPPGTAQKVQWPGRLPGTLSLLGRVWDEAEVCTLGGSGKVARACAEPRHPPAAGESGERGQRACGEGGRCSRPR